MRTEYVSPSHSTESAGLRPVVRDRPSTVTCRGAAGFAGSASWRCRLSDCRLSFADTVGSCSRIGEALRLLPALFVSTRAVSGPLSLRSIVCPGVWHLPPPCRFLPICAVLRDSSAGVSCSCTPLLRADRLASVCRLLTAIVFLGAFLPERVPAGIMLMLEARQAFLWMKLKRSD